MFITLFNSYENEDEETLFNKTVFEISEDNWQEDVVNTVQNKKLDTAKKTTIFIPATSIPSLKTYIGPKAYLSLEDSEKENYFTFKAQDKIYKGNYKGEIASSKDFNKLDDIVTILTVDDNRFGSISLRHFELGCE